MRRTAFLVLAFTIACQSGSDQGSHVLNAFLSDEDKQKPSVRFSFSHENTKDDVDYTVDVIKQFIEEPAFSAS